MTSNKSFFSPAIFLNNLKRFKWGSFLYGIFLFFAVPFTFLMEGAKYYATRYLPETDRVPLLLSESYIIIPLLFAIVVPTVAAVLIFNNVHSPKQSVFVHALPVSRRENYVSDVLSGLVLMALPVIANGIILLIMSFTDYSIIMTPASVVYWVFVNLSVIFIMFSVASATAFLTGNAAVHIGINAFAHVLPMIVALFIAVMSETFLYGFMTTENFVSNEIILNTPLVWLFSSVLNYGTLRASMFASWMFWVFIAMSLVLYLVGYLLYRARKIELSGDVCAFSLFRPIFKYMTTASVAIFVFAILQDNPAPLFAYVEVAVAAAIVYFACEMLINKSFRVFGSYKGLLIFLAASTAILLFFGLTSVFGYETRIPSPQDIESAAIHENYRYDNVVVSDAELIENVRETHKYVIENRNIEENDSMRIFYVTYKLKNGNVIRRQYLTGKSIVDEALTKMFKNEEYKLGVTGLSELNLENVDEVRLMFNSSGLSLHEEIRGEKAQALMRALEKDVMSLSYNELSRNAATLSISLDISCTEKENRERKIFKTSELEEEVVSVYMDENMIRSFDIAINMNFKNVVAFLEENGYYEQFVSEASKSVWLLKEPIEFDGEFYHYDGENLKYKDFRIDASKCAKLSVADGTLAVETMLSTPRGSERKGRNYYVFINSGDYKDIWVPGDALIINEADLPDYLKKYL